MFLMILMTLLILGITFFQIVQGLFSALIMAILTVLSAAIAFTFYELLAAQLYAYQPAHADAIALLALFILPLLGLRWLYDYFLGGNVVFGVWADRIGGGVLGLITGIIAVGVLAVALQMLPLGRSILGYEPFDASLQRQDTLSPFYPDDFAVGLAQKLSAGSLGNDKPFARLHDNLLRELYCARNTAGYNSRIYSDASDIDGWMKVAGVYRPSEAELKALGDLPPNPLLPPPAQSRVVVVRVGVDELCREPLVEEDHKGFNWWYLPATHFRLVTAEGKSYYPVAYLTWDVANKRYTLNPDQNEKNEKGQPKQILIGNLLVGRLWKAEGGPRTLFVDWVYVLPDDPTEDKTAEQAQAIGKFDRPEYLVFRRVCKQPLPGSLLDGMVPGMPPVKLPGATTTPTQPQEQFLPLLTEPLPPTRR